MSRILIVIANELGGKEDGGRFELADFRPDVIERREILSNLPGADQIDEAALAAKISQFMITVKPTGEGPGARG